MILSCSGTLGTCCSDGALVVLIDVSRRVLDIIQLAVPIMLIIWASWGLIQMVIDPDMKNGQKKIINRFIIAVVVFLIPTLVNFVLGLMPDTFSLNACWKASKNKAEVARQNSTYTNPYDDKQKTVSIYANPDNYDPGDKSSDTEKGNGAGAGVNLTGTAQEQKLIAYAKKWLGKPYKYGGSWNGEEPWTNTDCVGFIRGVYKHFGYSVTGSHSKILKSPYKNVTNGPLRAGDIVVYEGHWAMLTGSGNEIIHNTRKGVIIGKDYTKSSRTIKAIMRVF